MMKMKLLTVVLSVFGAIGAALAAEVINVDLNGNDDDTPYIGNGAYDVGDVVWTVYYGGWGKPVGSARTESLAAFDEDWRASVYAAQVWLGDDAQNHSYLWGSALMDDGFVADEGQEPKISIFGEGQYQGVYDIYVYGSEAGDFNLMYHGTSTVQSVDGDANEGQFELGHNYVVFPNVDINDADPDNIYMTYTNVINGLQFVKLTSPIVIDQDDVNIPAGDFAVCGERNFRVDENEPFGPELYERDPNDPNLGLAVGYLDIHDFMTYDITVPEANQGQYNISVGVATSNSWPCYALNIYLDDEFLGDVNCLDVSPDVVETTTVIANLFTGDHTLSWEFPREGWQSTGFNVEYIRLDRLGDVVNE